MCAVEPFEYPGPSACTRYAYLIKSLNSSYEGFTILYEMLTVDFTVKGVVFTFYTPNDHENHPFRGGSIDGKCSSGLQTLPRCVCTVHTQFAPIPVLVSAFPIYSTPKEYSSDKNAYLYPFTVKSPRQFTGNCWTLFSCKLRAGRAMHLPASNSHHQEWVIAVCPLTGRLHKQFPAKTTKTIEASAARGSHKPAPDLSESKPRFTAV